MKKIFICFFILFSKVILAQDKNNLVFEESIYSIEIKIENDKNYLELGKENKIQIITKNINPVNMSCVGRGLKRGVLSNGTNHTNWITMVDNEGLKDGKYFLVIAFKGRRGKLFKHEFLIDVK